MVEAIERSKRLAQEWGVEIRRSIDTPSSMIGLGSRSGEPVLLKVVKTKSDEWYSGDVLEALASDVMIPVIKWEPGAILVPALTPGHSLNQICFELDEASTDIFASVLERMPEVARTVHAPTAEKWGEGFQRYRSTADRSISPEIVYEAEQLFLELCSTQTHRRLLHGDLHHENVLRDDTLGWRVIDPKGVIAELEYEVGAFMRNPVDRESIYMNASNIEQRFNRIAEVPRLDINRAKRWTFAQAILSAIWSIEDGEPVDSISGSLSLADCVKETF